MSLRALARAAVVLALISSVALVPASAAEPDLDAARALYAEASYEEALAKLGTTPAVKEGDSPQVEQYRALCLLALGRGPEAEEAMTRLVVQQPLYRLDTNPDVSPKLAALFRLAREKALPTAARRIYTRGRQHYERREFSDAIKAFKEFSQLTTDPDAAARAEELADLKQLSDGFLRLAELEVLAAAKAAADAAAEEQRRAPRVYTASDRDVISPVPVAQALPEWRAPTAELARARLRGVLELLIDEQGRVETASLREPLSPGYDDRLLRAAREWKFVPAKKGDQAVRYIRIVEIVLQPQSP